MFSFGSTFFYLHIFLVSPSSSSCSVVEAVSSNIDKAPILPPSANFMVCGDFNAHNSEWLPTVYSYSKVDWDRLWDHLRDVPWHDIFKHGATYAAKEITEWVEISIDCYIPHRKFQLKPHSSPWFTPSCATAIAHPNHYFHQYNRNANPDNKKLCCDSHNHCNNSSKMRGLIMPKQLLALLHLSLSDLVTSGWFATAFSTVTSLPYLHFLMAQRSWQHLLTKLTSFLGSFHAIPPSLTIFHLVLNRNLAVRISCNLSWCIQTTGPDRIPAIVLNVFSRGFSCYCYVIQ